MIQLLKSKVTLNSYLFKFYSHVLENKQIPNFYFGSNFNMIQRKYTSFQIKNMSSIHFCFRNDQTRLIPVLMNQNVYNIYFPFWLFFIT